MAVNLVSGSDQVSVVADIASESGAIHNRIWPISMPLRLFVLNRVFLFGIAHKAISRRASLSKDLFSLVLKFFSGIVK